MRGVFRGPIAVETEALRTLRFYNEHTCRFVSAKACSVSSIDKPARLGIPSPNHRANPFPIPPFAWA
jgi:hypothetical protein